MQQRIFGFENEYAITATLPGRRDRFDTDHVARRLFTVVKEKLRHPLDPATTNVFLTNGARLYLDVGSHPEYATPECDDYADLVAADKAGERILEGLLLETEQRLRADGIPATLYLFKNNVDSAGNTYGCHENYLTAKGDNFIDPARGLVTFLTTRQLLVGAGRMHPLPGGGVEYRLSQRAEHMSTAWAKSTTRQRGMIAVRDEPLADSGRFQRLHLIVGDSNMSETTNLLKVGSTDLVLRLMEARVNFADLALAKPAAAAQQISRDITGRVKVQLVTGREMSALELQGEYLSRVCDFADAKGLTQSARVRQVLDLWTRTLEAVAKDDLSLVEREIDWVAKHLLIERYRAKHDLPGNSPRLAQLDLAYHDIRRDRGLYYLAERHGRMERVTTDLQVFQAKVRPPETTRAWLRGGFLREARARNVGVTVDWHTVRVNGPSDRSVLCGDPRRPVDERVSRLIATM